MLIGGKNKNMIAIIFKMLGATGLIFITIGVITKKALPRNYYFIIGGVLLFCYSAYLKDPVFIPLQIIFTVASIYEIFLLKKK